MTDGHSPGWLAKDTVGFGCCVVVGFFFFVRKPFCTWTLHSCVRLSAFLPVSVSVCVFVFLFVCFALLLLPEGPGRLSDSVVGLGFMSWSTIHYQTQPDDPIICYGNSYAIRDTICPLPWFPAATGRIVGVSLKVDRGLKTCNCTRVGELCEHRKRVCTESRVWERSKSSCVTGVSNLRQQRAPNPALRQPGYTPTGSVQM